MGASGVDWNNVPHETILSQINGGAGVGPVNDAAASYRRIASTLREADQDLRDALAAVGASWEGQAAGGMQAASTPLAVWADEADRMAMQTSSATDLFGEQFAAARSSMPAAVSVPSGSWVDGTGLSAVPGVTTDRERAEAAADAAHQEAARIMEAYDNASYETVRTQYFSQPPEVVLDVPPPAEGGASPAGGTSAAAGGTAYGGCVYPASSGYAGSGSSTAGGTAPAGAVPGATVPGSSGGGPATTVLGRWSWPDSGAAGPGGAGHPPGVPGTYSTGDYGPSGYRLGGSGAGAGPGAGSAGIGSAVGSGDAHGQRGATTPSGYASPAAGGVLRDEDAAHRRPDYLVETEDVWGDGTRVAPPVIGERQAW